MQDHNTEHAAKIVAASINTTDIQNKAAATIVGATDWQTVQAQTKYLGSVEVDWDIWACVPEHPVQRMTSHHAAQLVLSAVLSTPLDVHRSVAAVIVGDIAQSERTFKLAGCAIVNDPAVTKLDGHSRTLAQFEQKVPKPETVIVHLYAAATAPDSAKLYQAFDSSVSSKKVADKGQSALHAAGIAPVSKLFESAGVVLKALKLAAAVIDDGTVHVRKAPKFAALPAGQELSVDDAMALLVPGLEQAKRFKQEILFLDALKIGGRHMAANADAIGAYLVMLVRDPETAQNFLTQLRAGKGESVDGVADALFMASQVMKSAADKRKKLKGIERTQAIVATLLNCFLGFKTGENYDANKAPAAVGVIAGLFEKDRRAAAKLIAE